MKKYSYLICLLILESGICAQGTLEQLFYDLPAEYSMEFDLAKKHEEIADMKANPDSEHGSFLDEPNGYLRRVGNQCNYELCYWKNFLADSTGISHRKLVAVIDGCQTKPVFLIEENGQFTKTSFKDFDTFDARRFFKEDVELSVIEAYLTHFRFTLPRSGYNITAHYSGAYGEKEKADLLVGDKIDFIWKDDSFTLGKPYF